MDILLVLLGAQLMLIAALMKTSRVSASASGSAKGTAPAWGVRAALFAGGAVLIALGILVRVHRHGLI